MAVRSAWVPDRQDIIWIDCNPQVGSEMRDIHPMLVLSPRIFNDKTGLVIGLPMTTAQASQATSYVISPSHSTGDCAARSPIRSSAWETVNSQNPAPC